jgi:hypothetical protein
MSALQYDTQYEPSESTALEKFSFKARPSGTVNTDYRSRVRDLKKRFPKILARLAE